MLSLFRIETATAIATVGEEYRITLRRPVRGRGRATCTRREREGKRERKEIQRHRLGGAVEEEVKWDWDKLTSSRCLQKRMVSKALLTLHNYLTHVCVCVYTIRHQRPFLCIS